MKEGEWQRHGILLSLACYNENVHKQQHFAKDISCIISLLVFEKINTASIFKQTAI